MTAQLTLDFSAIARDDATTYSIAYLRSAANTYSADKITECNKIRGIFYHLGTPFVCTGCCYLWGLLSVNLCRLYSPSEWELIVPIQDPPYRWGHRIEHRGQTWIMGDRITLEANPEERAIAIAQEKIKWSLNKLDRTMPYATGEQRDQAGALIIIGVRPTKRDRFY